MGVVARRRSTMHENGTPASYKGPGGATGQHRKAEMYSMRQKKGRRATKPQGIPAQQGCRQSRTGLPGDQHGAPRYPLETSGVYDLRQMTQYQLLRGRWRTPRIKPQGIEVQRDIRKSSSSPPLLSPAPDLTASLRHHHIFVNPHHLHSRLCNIQLFFISNRVVIHFTLKERRIVSV